MPVLGTLVFVVRDDCVLLQRRVKPPFVGRWVAPGGRVDEHEAPYKCAVRELREETGLVAGSVSLRAVFRETAPRADFDWLVFAYLAHDVSGAVTSDEREGPLRWWPVSEIDDIAMPKTDRTILPHVIGSDPRLLELKFSYDADLHLTGRTESFSRLRPGASGSPS